MFNGHSDGLQFLTPLMQWSVTSIELPTLGHSWGAFTSDELRRLLSRALIITGGNSPARALQDHVTRTRPDQLDNLRCDGSVDPGRELELLHECDARDISSGPTARGTRRSMGEKDRTDKAETEESDGEEER
jgi:hypothetical protein